MDHAIGQQTAVPSSRDAGPIDAMRPLVWLARGWSDLKRAAGPSLGYGLWVALFGFALMMVAWQFTYLAPALLGGFLLVAPFVAIVFYALSQQIERGEPVDGALAVFAWRRNSGSIALWGLMLALALIFWERLAAVLFALSYGGEVTNLESLLRQVFTSGRYLPLLAVYFAVGGLFALAVFVLGVVTAPMLLDRDVDIVTAAMASVQACRAHPGATFAWAVIIAVLTAVGFATLMIGLVVIFPLLGHASWHAYRDLIR
jgi:uncharacterized membrane protein